MLWSRCAAASGDAAAQFSLGGVYLFGGCGALVDKAVNKANDMALWRQMAAGGHNLAQRHFDSVAADQQALR